ncbi:hypothetical protein SAMN05192558_10783 [Actinokineospora alba]|uniref:Uncharacterized protein n=1 Tax=Actinokineospora alba TaxID=504798 RepID=A0A1H0QR26_9PSEU|nr:hypothetical protein [Actinokineospora alba]TDP70458.1 hypothetical protein C8E96_6068 [Actinokineospora alba]SDI31175.1 hypothetical protein SAMN05421871_10482 [Actinokineospora alba]SDP19138.1 hypothetical protein SAMN05192558_10783 [Actinokineospora alba]
MPENVAGTGTTGAKDKVTDAPGGAKDKFGAKDSLDASRSAEPIFTESRRLIAIAEAFTARADFHTVVAELADMDGDHLKQLADDGFTTYLLAHDVDVPKDVTVNLRVPGEAEESLLDTTISVCVHTVDSAGHHHDYGIHLTIFGWTPGC